MAEGDAQAAIDRLHGVPLEDFVAERKRLAGELRAGGDRAAAAELAKLPKPSPPAWALNNVAREEPEAIEEWLAAAAALREASTHAAQVGGDALRAAMAAHRAATAHVMEVVADRARPGGRPLSDAMLDRVRRLLAATTADAALADRLRAGCMTEERAERDAASASESQSERPATTPPARPPRHDAEARARQAPGGARTSHRRDHEGGRAPA